MGGLEIRNKSLRCEKCLDIKRLTIFPQYPEPILKMECRCSEKNTKLFEFLTEFKKKENFVIKCSKCQNINPKITKYCFRCQKIYCNKCSDLHEQLSNRNEEKKENEEINENNENNNIIHNIFIGLGHKGVTIGNIDYQCIIHSNEKFAGFCKKCSLNICQKCINENIHYGHEISKFSEILLDHKKKEIIAGCLGLCLDKISHNEKISKKIKKKIKSEENKKLISTLLKANKKINESILEFFYLMNDIYEKSKNMNYSIIFNARKNTAFNIRLINFEDGNEEEDALKLIEYFKNDFILETDFSKKKRQEQKENINNNIINNNGNVINDSKAVNQTTVFNDKGKNEIEIEEEKIDDDKIIHTKGNNIIEEEEIKEIKKDKIILIETNKEEEKKEPKKEKIINEELKEKINLIKINKEKENKNEEVKKNEIILEEKKEEVENNVEIKIEIKQEENKIEENKNEEIKEEKKVEEIKEKEVKKDDIKIDEDKNEEIKIEIKKEEDKKENINIKKDEIILEEKQRDELKEKTDKNSKNKIEIKQEENKEEEIKKEEVEIAEIKIEIKKEENKTEEKKEEENKIEEIKEIKEKENKIEEIKNEEHKEEVIKIEEVKIENIKEKEKEPVEKKEENKEEKKEDNNNKDKKEKKPSHPLSSIGAKAELFKKMMQVRGGGILGHHSLEKKNSAKNPENNIKIEPTKNEGNTVEILSNLKVTKVAKKKPKKINFDD